MTSFRVVCFCALSVIAKSLVLVKMCQFHGTHAFLFEGNLQSHVLTHTGVKPYSCNICTWKFISSSNLRTHIRTHHCDENSELQMVPDSGLGVVTPTGSSMGVVTPNGSRDPIFLQANSSKSNGTISSGISTGTLSNSSIQFFKFGYF